MSSGHGLFSRAHGSSSARRLPGILSSKASCTISPRSIDYRTQVEFCMMGRGCVIESLGTFPKRRNCSSNARRTWSGERSCTKLRRIDVAQFCAMLSAPSMTRVRGEGELAAECQPSTASRVIVETLGEPLKYVVNARLPIERLKQNITSLSRAVGMRLAQAEFSVDLV
jgi:hypothetical protein